MWSSQFRAQLAFDVVTPKQRADAVAKIAPEFREHDRLRFVRCLVGSAHPHHEGDRRCEAGPIIGLGLELFAADLA